MGNAANEPVSFRRRTMWVDADQSAIDGRIAQKLPQLATSRVISDDTSDRHCGSQSAEETGDAGGTTQPHFVRFSFQHDDWHFRAKAVGHTARVSIKDEVSHNDETRSLDLFPIVGQRVHGVDWPDKAQMAAGTFRVVFCARDRANSNCRRVGSALGLSARDFRYAATASS